MPQVADTCSCAKSRCSSSFSLLNKSNLQQNKTDKGLDEQTDKTDKTSLHLFKS